MLLFTSNMADDQQVAVAKAHRAKQAGPKAKQKKSKVKGAKNGVKKNPKAFTIQSVNKAAKTFHRTADLAAKKLHVPLVDRTPVEPPPIMVAVVGPPKVGKTTLLRSLVKNFTRQKISDIQGPVTVVAGKHKRLTLIECGNDINCMIDVAKVADLVLLLIDASFGFEMEIFEFLNIAQVHGFPKIMGVMTHLDLLRNNKSLKKQKKKMKHRFWTEVYQGAKLFNLSGISHGTYPKTEIHNLGRFISVMKFRPLTWRTNHPYIIADRVEDITNPELVRQHPKCNRTISFYGYTRGAHLKENSQLHVVGCGDFSMKNVSYLPDPCPLPEKEKRRSLNERERLLYAPMSGVGGIMYDKDAVYIDLGGSKAGQRLSAEAAEQTGESNELVTSLLSTVKTIDQKMEDSQLTIFKGSAPISAEQLNREVNDDLPAEMVVTSEGGRHRRLAVFDDDGESESDGDEEEGCNEDNEDDSGVDTSESEDIEEESDDDDTHGRKRRKIETEHCETLEFEDTDDDDGDVATGGDNDNNELEKLKIKLKEKIAPFMAIGRNKAADLRKLIYDEDPGREVDNARSDGEDENEEDMIGGIFKVRGSTFFSEGSSKAVYHKVDCSTAEKTKFEASDLQAIKDLIQDCFVTGKWGKDEDAAQLLEEDDEEIFGDFEDLETGDVFQGTKPVEQDKNNGDLEDMGDGEDDENQMETEENEEEKTEREERKKKLKETFDNEYDEDQGGSSYYDDLKDSMSKQAQINQSEFADMDDAQRVKYEGFRAGMYVRIEALHQYFKKAQSIVCVDGRRPLDKVPCEFIENFDPGFPVIAGGVLSGEDSLGYLQIRFKKHRWHDRILKNRDPLIVSIGWRRFQTLPLYSSQDHNGRYRSLKYTPEHLHCIATMYGPTTPANTGVLAVQSVSGISSKFRIAGTGVIVNLDKSVQVMKKLKLTGTPLKIYKNTAFIKGMFNSSLEVAKFEGATIRTVSGIRGQVKRALKSPPGAFRATFEDKILMSDIVFCRTWYPLQCPQYYNPVTSLLLAKGGKGQWTGMRTVGQMRKELGIAVPQNQDSFYKPVERQDRKFNPLHIPDKLKKDLPFKSKPKEMRKRKRKTLEQKRAVVMEPEEKKIYSFMQEIVTLHKEKVRKRKEKQRERKQEYEKKVNAEAKKREGKLKEQRKKVYRMMGQMEKKKEKESKR